MITSFDGYDTKLFILDANFISKIKTANN